jgi:hypothetical protein
LLTDLEVQVALYPESMITTDPMTGADVCPSDTQYDAVNGFPIESEVSPAAGGRAFYRPGDETIFVTLGCTNLEAVNDAACVGVANVHVAASIDNFDTGLTVDPAQADHLSVGVGEPRSFGGTYVLNPGDITPLDRTVNFPPAWGTDVDHLFNTYACLSVLDDAAMSTTAVTCRAAAVTDGEIEFTGKPAGARLTKPSLDQILSALSLTFPSQGLTIGVVLDRNGDPLAGQVVSAPGATVQYLSSDRKSIVGTSTSGGVLGGVFVSTDAPFGTLFTTSIPTPSSIATAIGGRIEGKVTLAILRLRDPVVGGGN